MSELVAEGRRLLAIEAEQRAARQRDADEAVALAELRTVTPVILELLGAVSSRLASLEAEISELKRSQMTTQDMVMATRVRKPIRDELGTILYVVDEMAPPEWAKPLTMVS